MEKKKLTSELLLKDYHGTRTQILFSIFVVAGLIAFLSPLLYYNSSRVKDTLLNMLLCSLIAVPFWCFSIPNILRAQKIKKKYKTGEYEVIEDFVTKKSIRYTSDISYRHGGNYYMLLFADYSEASGKNVTVDKKLYDSTKRGDGFLMVYIDGELVAHYPEKDFEL